MALSWLTVLHSFKAGTVLPSHQQLQCMLSSGSEADEVVCLAQRTIRFGTITKVLARVMLMYYSILQHSVRPRRWTGCPISVFLQV